MRRAVFISGGLGDTLLVLPLIKALRATSTRLVGIVTSSVDGLALFQQTALFDQLVVIRRQDWRWYLFCAAHWRAFTEVYVPLIGMLTKEMRRLARLVADRIVTHDSYYLRRMPRRTRYLEPVVGLHDSVQNLRLFVPDATAAHLNQGLIDFPAPLLHRIQNQPLTTHIQRFVQSPYLAIQVSAVEGPFPQKSWPLECWMRWLRLVSARFPQFRLVLIGSHRETAAAEAILHQGIPRVESVVCQTSIVETAQLLAYAEMFVGLDGGLMHLAAAMRKPTFTLWGASNPSLYGYEQMDSRQHRVVSLHLPCGPCESWVGANRGRVQHARECPDFRCIRTLSPDAVFEEFQDFQRRLLQPYPVPFRIGETRCTS